MGLMSLNLATSNARGLRDPSKSAHLLGKLSKLSVSERDSLFICVADCRLCCSFSITETAGVCLLIGPSLDADVNVVFTGQGAGWLCPMLPLKASSSGWQRFMHRFGRVAPCLFSLVRGILSFDGWHPYSKIRSS